MTIIDYPWQIFLLSMLAFSLAAWLGASMRRSATQLAAEEREDFGVVLAAALTLLGLIIGFTFSMAISRYDQRKNYEEAEANAIGTEYARADLLPDDAARTTRQHLKEYTGLRLQFYAASGHEQLTRVNDETNRLQQLLWSDVSVVGKAQSNPIIALVVSGMNDVLNSQGYTQAAWWNRIPVAAWGLMTTIAVVCNMMIGYNSRHVSRLRSLRFLFPFILSVSFFLIADIDSPRGGVIRVIPQNLTSLMDTLH
jgi:protein-S-isoprenylcysteine O-methyltransferase Ste14